MSGIEDRRYWLGIADKLATPVLENLAHRRLKATMPVEAHDPKNRATVTHLEALGRLLCGLAPWLELGAGADAEGSQRTHFLTLARESIDAATDPASPDFMNFTQGGQPLVDAAFLAHALLRAPQELWGKLDVRVRRNLVAGLTATRPIVPGRSNWVLFASMVEAALKKLGEPWDKERLTSGLRDFQQWYLGDGIYGDGAPFHWDYYNSFVIQPMLVNIVPLLDEPEWQSFRDEVFPRAQRYAAIQERLIAPDGSYPAIGRSITYRCGAFQSLAQAALQHRLPKEVSPAQARGALTAVIQRTLEPPGTFDAQGWLRIGLVGHQPSLGEGYISTGSLYLCSFALLPLGLPPDDPFWSDPPEAWTARKIWGGQDLPADHAI